MARPAKRVIWGAAVPAAALSFLAGCCSLDKPAPAPVVKVVPTTQYYRSDFPATGPAAGTTTARQAVPTGSVLLLEKSAPGEVLVGQEFIYTIKATNLARREIDGIVVTDSIPPGIEYKASSPPAVRTANVLTWNLGALEGGASAVIVLKAAATGTGEFTSCVRATYQEKLFLTIKAVPPRPGLGMAAGAETLAHNQTEPPTHAGQAEEAPEPRVIK